MNSVSLIKAIAKCLKRCNDDVFLNQVIDIGRDGRNLYFQRLGDLNATERLYLIDFSKYKDNGMCAFIRFTLDKLIYAEYHNLIPIVRWGTETYYSEADDRLNNIDAFNKFFVPINPEYMNSVDHSFMVAESTMGDCILPPGYDKTYDVTDDGLTNYALVYKKYVKPSAGLQHYLSENAFIFTDRVLGVHVRGTDYNSNFRNHPKAILVDDYLRVAKDTFDTGNYSKVFLATDDSKTVDRFRMEFGNSLTCYQDTFRSTDDRAVHGTHGVREHHETLLGFEVLRDVYTLARCNGLVASLSNVPLLSRVVSRTEGNGYEDEIILNQGININGKKFHG